MTIETVPKDKKIVLFDGVCNLCNTSVKFIIKRDKKDIFRFVSLQSELGQIILKQIGFEESNYDRIILYEPNGSIICFKSSAILKILIHLGGIYKIAYLFTFFPKHISDKLYDFVARNRYKWFGKQDSCILPSDDIKAKFLA